MRYPEGSEPSGQLNTLSSLIFDTTSSFSYGGTKINTTNLLTIFKYDLPKRKSVPAKRVFEKGLLTPSHSLRPPEIKTNFGIVCHFDTFCCFPRKLKF
ncbi:hypothetical protein CEXT_108251 [Caerostris extrusa]|uniref:Uncharacterized protein n=1 Tax=Caerostris extrusa TaxID=172846 RepID=A0AAV4RY68_CAEEX|nr:hypothetical protein CEXT_108251 [Caerostris extrusa]